MKDVTYDNYGTGWMWHGTSGKQRHAYATARTVASRLYGKKAVEFVERLCKCGDEHVIGYVLETVSLRHLVSLSIGGVGYLCDTLLETAELGTKRWQAYTQACATLNITRYPNLPPNWDLVILAGETKSPHRVRHLSTLQKVGQFGGRFGSLSDEQAKHITKNWQDWHFEYAA